MSDTAPIDYEAAIKVLKASERGRRVGAILLRLLDEGGLGLDSNGQVAVMDILGAVWIEGNRGSVLWSLDENFGANRS